MNFAELSELWNQNKNGHTRIQINEKLLKEVSLNAIKNNLKEVKWTSIIEIVVNYIWLFFLVEFIVVYFAQYRFSLPAAILILISIYSVIFETYRLILYYSINNQLSIIKTQRKLEKLKSLELFDNNSLYFFIPIFFIPFIVVFTKGFLGIDLYELGFSEREILFGTAGTLLVSIIIIFLLKMFPNKELRDSIDFVEELNEIQSEG